MSSALKFPRATPAFVFLRKRDRRIAVSAKPPPLKPPWIPYSTSTNALSEYSLPVSKYGCVPSHDCSTATDATCLPSKVNRTNREYATPFNQSIVPPGSPSQTIVVVADLLRQCRC